MVKFETTPSRSSVSSSPSSWSEHSNFPPTFIGADHCINLVPLSNHGHHDFRSRKVSFSGCLNVSPKPWDRLKLWWNCFPLMACQETDFPGPVSLEDRNKKFPGQQKSGDKNEAEISVLHKMLDKLQRRQSNDSSLSMLSNSLPPKMKELLSELEMVENEITRLECQISQLKYEEKHEKESHVEYSKAKRTLDYNNNDLHESNEKVAFDIKALHFITKAIKGEYKEKCTNNSSKRFSTRNRKEDENAPFQEKVLRRNGTVKPSSPSREPRHPTPWLDIKFPSTPLHTEEENIQRWSPNKLSENIMKCLVFIFVRLLRTSRAIELEKSGPIIRASSSFSLSFRAETSSNSKTGPAFQKESRQQDPYGIFDCEESIPRDIGPYKNLVRFTSSSMDAKCIKNSSSVPLFQKLKVLMDGLRRVDLRFLSHRQKLAFWINMYNACIMHGFLQYGVPSVSSPEKLLTLINKATLTIAGSSINAHAIERFILRKPSDSPDKEILGRGGKDNKQMIVHQLYGLETPDPNIVFALCCGARSSPAVKIYTAEGVTGELERSKLEYLQAAIMVKSNKRIGIPELVLKNKHDFADHDVDSLMEWLCRQLPTSGTLRKSIINCFRGRRGGDGAYSVVVENIPYEFEFQYLLAI
ncbi:hypothetical protein ABFX02_14G245400 [Erythranthe guttata]